MRLHLVLYKGVSLFVHVNSRPTLRRGTGECVLMTKDDILVQLMMWSKEERGQQKNEPAAVVTRPPAKKSSSYYYWTSLLSPTVCSLPHCIDNNN